jgi:signal transduction histidine kinase
MLDVWKNVREYPGKKQTFEDTIKSKMNPMTRHHAKNFMILLRIAEPEFFEFVFGSFVIHQHPFTQCEKVSEMLYLKMVTRQKELELRQLKRLHKEAIRALKENEKREKENLARLATRTLIPLPRTSQTKE